MNCSDVIKTICYERKIPIRRLESDLGFSNGYISQLKSKSMKADRAKKVAAYLDIPTDYLMVTDLDAAIQKRITALYNSDAVDFSQIPYEVMQSVLDGAYTFDSAWSFSISTQ